MPAWELKDRQAQGTPEQDTTLFSAGGPLYLFMDYIHTFEYYYGTQLQKALLIARLEFGLRSHYEVLSYAFRVSNHLLQCGQSPV